MYSKKKVLYILPKFCAQQKEASIRVLPQLSQHYDSSVKNTGHKMAEAELVLGVLSMVTFPTMDVQELRPRRRGTRR